MITTVLRWAGTTRTLSLGTLVLTTLISYGFLGFAVLQGWPLWLVALAVLVLLVRFRTNRWLWLAALVAVLARR